MIMFILHMKLQLILVCKYSWVLLYSMFSLRIVTVDYYLRPPIAGLDPFYSTFRGADVKKVPIIRIFGVTPVGKLIFNIYLFQFDKFFLKKPLFPEYNHHHHMRYLPGLI